MIYVCLSYDSFYDVSLKLSLSQININTTYDFRDSFMKWYEP